ncbi:MAG: MDR family MFS transporter [Sulfurifustaceae bacterium]
MLAILLGALDQTIVAVSLPSISAQLHGFEIVAWVVSGYLVASTVITPIYGKLSDLYGARALLSVAIVLFLVASVACAVSQSMPQLVAARILQGLGGGGLISLAQAIIPQVVSLRDRGRYQGYISGVYAVASVAGPVVGGFLTHYLSWRWVFWINLPLGAAAFIVSRRALARLPVPGRKPHIDYAGALLLTAGLAALLIAITRVGQGVSWYAPGNLSLFGAAVAILAVCLWHERRAREPILPLALFKIRTVALCCAIVFLAFFQLIPLVTLMPLRLEMLSSVSAGAVGVRLVPLTLGIPFGAYAAGTLMAWTGRYKPWQLTGAAVVPVAIVALAAAGSHDIVWMSVCMAFVGFAMGMQLPTALVAAQNAVPVHYLGVGTAAIAFFRTLGGAIGVAVLSAILLALLRYDVAGLVAIVPGGETLREMVIRALATADPAQHARLLEAAESSFRRVLYISASISVISVALAYLITEQPLRARAMATAERDAPLSTE